jgi:hypothetical protein
MEIWSRLVFRVLESFGFTRTFLHQYQNTFLFGSVIPLCLLEILQYVMQILVIKLNGRRVRTW